MIRSKPNRLFRHDADTFMKLNTPMKALDFTIFQLPDWRRQLGAWTAYKTGTLTEEEEAIHWSADFGGDNSREQRPLYARAKIGGSMVRMHRLVLRLGKGEKNGSNGIIDHKDGCGLNNRKTNLDGEATWGSNGANTHDLAPLLYLLPLPIELIEAELGYRPEGWETSPYALRPVIVNAQLQEAA